MTTLTLKQVIKDLADHVPEVQWPDLVKIAAHNEPSPLNMTHVLSNMRLWRDRDRSNPVSVKFAEYALDSACRRLRIVVLAS